MFSNYTGRRIVKMYFRTIILLVAINAICAQKRQDALCVAKNCPSSTTCRVVKTCPTPTTCTLEAQCLSQPPEFSHRGVCQIGEPILVMRDGILGDTYCGPRTPCPDGTYCNTELQDTYSTCCRSDPTNPVKPGQCPPTEPMGSGDDFWCMDTCGNDGDCRHDYKCCQLKLNCQRRCIKPIIPNPCLTKTCPHLTFCLSPDLPPTCSSSTKCFSVGDCVACPPTCRMRSCRYGQMKDPVGCPVCACEPPPNSQFNPFTHYSSNTGRTNPITTTRVTRPTQPPTRNPLLNLYMAYFYNNVLF